MIGHVDCTAGDNINKELCNSNGVNGFPTLNIYKDGVKVRRLLSLFNQNQCQYFLQVEEYSGKRDLSVLQDFVEKHLAAKTVEKEAKDEL